MPYVYYNPNPVKASAGDCVIRAICKATGKDWDSIYSKVTFYGFLYKEMPSSNNVWGAYLKSIGFVKRIVPNSCPDCYSIKEFCIDNPIGVFLVVTDGHVVAIENGNYYDTWDSGNEVPIYYWTKGA